MFTINAYHNPYMRAGQDAMQVVLSVSLDDDIIATPAPLALAIAIDYSASMEGPKMIAAREGAINVVKLLDTDMAFMVVGFNTRAHVVYGPAMAYNEDIIQATNAIHRLHASGGTCMSTALNMIVDKLQVDSSYATHILFLTDGRNEGELRPALNAAVARCAAANITVSAWGIGTDWDARELRHIADATRGSADIIPNPKQVNAAFAAAFQKMSKTAVAQSRLRLWTPAGVAIKAISQVYPNIIQLSPEPDATNARQQVISLGAFAPGDVREYLLDITMPPHEPGQQFLLIRPTINYAASGSEVEEKIDRTSWVFGQWTEDLRLAAQIEPHIAHYTHQEELSRNIEQGQAALAAGEREKATNMLAKALEISERTGNAPITKLLSEIVYRDSAGTVRLNQSADEVARKSLAINVNRTSKLN